MTLVLEQHEFLQDVALLIQRAVALGYVVTGGELYRTAEQEQWDVAHGLSRTENSAHLRRLAIDLNVFSSEGVGATAADLGSYWKALDSHNRWGGDFTTLRDYGHFERSVP